MTVLTHTQLANVLKICPSTVRTWMGRPDFNKFFVNRRGWIGSGVDVTEEFLEEFKKFCKIKHRNDLTQRLKYFLTRGINENNNN